MQSRMLLTLHGCRARDAWSSNHSLSRTEAKRRYITTLIDTMHKYASTTPEARDLVAELEFVWDQIKSNPASSSASSPGQRIGAVAESGQQQGMSYASLGPEQQSRGEVDSRGLRVLRPVSDGDEEGLDEGDDFEEARSGLTDDEQNEEHGIRTRQSGSRDLDVRNRKWRKRVEEALIRMTAEVAALREQLEARRLSEGRPRKRVFAWMVWITWALIKHVSIDATVLAFLYLWSRWKDDTRLELGLKILIKAITRKVRPIRLLRISQPKANG